MCIIGGTGFCGGSDHFVNEQMRAICNGQLLGAQAVAKPVDHKRMTRRKWWLVRKAIPLPWVRR